ncbi:Caspase-4, partial [Galemys pyrenaicus]
VKSFETVTTGATSTESTGKLKLCPRENFLELCRENTGSTEYVREKKCRVPKLPFFCRFIQYERKGTTLECLALIICNTEFKNLPKRTGSNHDIIGMKGLLEDLDYNVHVEENLTARHILVFMSHGVLDKICGTMHSNEKPEVLTYDTIFQIFNTHNCLYLKDKQKVIIIQACRGVDSVYVQGTEPKIVFYFQVQKSFEEPEFKVQMPTIERSTMTRHFYLFPGN